MASKPRAITWRVDANGCHLCTSHKPHVGYPVAYRHGRLVRLSRLIFERTYGPIPRGISVCHACDNPLCINPEHLFLGTQADNVKDRDMKGRTSKGSNHYKAKLTEKDVKMIRRSHRNGMELAKMFGLHHSTVYAIINHTSWKSVG